MNITLLEFYAGLVAAHSWPRAKNDPEYTPQKIATDAFVLAHELVKEAEKQREQT